MYNYILLLGGYLPICVLGSDDGRVPLDHDGRGVTAEMHRDDQGPVSTEPGGESLDDGDSTRAERAVRLFRGDCVVATFAFAIEGSSASYYGTEV